MTKIIGRGDYIVLSGLHRLSGGICVVMDATKPSYILVRILLFPKQAQAYEPEYSFIDFLDMEPYTGDITQLEAEICLLKL